MEGKAFTRKNQQAQDILSTPLSHSPFLPCMWPTIFVYIISANAELGARVCRYNIQFLCE